MLLEALAASKLPTAINIEVIADFTKMMFGSLGAEIVRNDNSAGYMRLVSQCHFGKTL